MMGKQMFAKRFAILWLDKRIPCSKICKASFYKNVNVFSLNNTINNRVRCVQ